MISGYTDALGATFTVAAHLLSAQPGINIDDNALNIQEVFCLAQSIWHESKNTSKKDKIMVANVIINRVLAPDRPDTICEVVWQDYQFSWTNDGIPDDIVLKNKIERNSWSDTVTISLLVYYGYIPDVTNGATFYHSHKVYPRWASSFYRVGETDGHTFYRKTPMFFLNDMPIE